MSSEASVRVKHEESFLMEDLLDQRLVRETAMGRAAQISPYVTSVTLGPNSSFQNEVKSSELPPRILVSLKNAPENATIKRTVKHYKSPIKSDDLRSMQIKFQQQVESKRVNEEVRMKLEERLIKEKEHNRKVQAQLELMKEEAEKKHKAKVEELKRQIEIALKFEEQDEVIYQKQRAELAKNTRKLLEQQEKELQELRDVLKKLDDHFSKLEQNFIKITRNCSPEMSATVDFCRSQFDELKTRKVANPSSIEVLKVAIVKGEEICHSLIKAANEFEVRKQAHQKEEEDKHAASEALAKLQYAAQLASQSAAQEAKQPDVPTEAQQPRPPASQLGVYYSQLMQFVNDKQNATRQLSESSQLEGIRFALKLAVNKPINMLNEKDKTTLQQSFIDLEHLLMGREINTAKGAVSIAVHPEASDWVKLRIAEKLINVCDKKTATTFYVAALAVALCQKFPDFKTFLIAKLMKECPFLLPYKPSQLKGQSDNDFLKTWGYRVYETCEPYTQYQSRTTNYAAFLAAIWITTSRRNENALNPFGIDSGWRFLINVLNSTPDPTYCHLIEKVLEVAGASLHAAYGQQFTKLIMTIRDRYLPLVESNVDDVMRAAIGRLRTAITKFFTDNRFVQPSGKLMPNYW